MHFEGHSAVFLSLRKIAGRLDELGIPYAIAGGMALFAHGFRRFTEDVHPLVTPDGLAQIHAALDGLGYVPPFLGSKQLRDGETQVRIEFLVAGQFPGDGRPKPVAFPDPTTVSIEIEGIRYLNLSTTTARLRHRTGRFEPRSREDAKQRRGERRSNTSVFAFVLASRPRGFAVQTYAAATKVRCSIWRRAEKELGVDPLGKGWKWY